jgi:AAA+ ATPase superfamily predicted ATPase
MKKKFNPFLTKGYISPEYFCDREKETEIIINAMENGRNITIYGRRKLGKTALIKHVFNNFSKKHICLWIDLLPTQNFSDMVNIIANNIYQAFEKDKSLAKKFLESFKVLRPVISYDELTGTPQIILDIRNKKQMQNSFEELFNILKLFKKPVVIALDEFQQILKYPEKDTEAYLRTIIQELPDVDFIFSGSDQHLLTQMFTSYDKPFYQMSQLLKLGLIDSEKYKNFILNHFGSSGKKIKPGDIEYVLNWAKGITFYVQMIFNRLFSQNIKIINRDTINSILTNILDEHEDSYYTYREMLTRTQWNILKAIAKEDTVSKIMAKDFLRKYGFYNASTVKKTVDSLIKDQLIYKSTNKESVQYEIQDIFFQRWLERL